MENHPHTEASELYRYCLAVAGTVWEAEDLMQDAWLRGLESGALAGHPNPKALLMRLAKRKWIDLKRRERTLARIVMEMAGEAADRQGEAADVRATDELEATLWSVARHLLPLQQAVFLLRGVLGLSAAEAAGVLCTTEGAVKSALFRARQALRHVREELAAGEGAPPVPEDEGIRTWLRTLAAGLRQGDVPAVVSLALAGAYEPILSVQTLHRERAKRQGRSVQPHMRMSAQHPASARQCGSSVFRCLRQPLPRTDRAERRGLLAAQRIADAQYGEVADRPRQIAGIAEPAFENLIRRRPGLRVRRALRQEHEVMHVVTGVVIDAG